MTQTSPNSTLSARSKTAAQKGRAAAWSTPTYSMACSRFTKLQGSRCSSLLRESGQRYTSTTAGWSSLASVDRERQDRDHAVPRRRTHPQEAVLLTALRRVCRQRSVVLGYHGVAELSLREDLSRLQVSPSRFSAQIDLLGAAGFPFVTLAELASRAEGGTPEPGLAAVTFDDGMRNNLHPA